jgi:hypothetical protein
MDSYEGGKMILTYRQYITQRARALRADYPDSTAAERRETLGQCEREWLTSIQQLGRDAVVSLDVGRSLVATIGHNEAGRMLRHVANYPACLPANRAKAIAEEL